MLVMAGAVGGRNSDEDGVESDGRDSAPIPTPSIRVHRVTILAIAFACGIAISWNWPVARAGSPWPWISAAGALLLGGAMFRARQQHFAMALLAASMIAIGAGWVTLTQERVNDSDLAAYMGDEQVLVRVRGIALGPPVLRSRTAGSMAAFDYREPATYFPMRIDALLDRNGAAAPIHGRALVRIDESVGLFRAGDGIEATGFLLRPSSPHNPGEFDYREYAKSLGQAGTLTVAQRELLLVTPAPHNAWLAILLNWRDQLRRRAGAWLMADLPGANVSVPRHHAPGNTANDEHDRDDAAALLANLMLGERDAQIDGIYESFQRVGLAHILAISGFHLSVLAGFVLMIARLATGHRRWHGWLIIAVVLVYLLLIEVHMPVLRAGVMTIAASIGLIAGRRLRAGGLVSLSAVLLLLWRPDQLFNAGFQLTYGVVLGLVYLAPSLRGAWFGEPNREAATTGEMLWEWLKTALAVSAAAWLVATPIAVFHFGMISPLGVILSVFAVPLSAFILALGFIKMVFSAVLPSAALIVGLPLTLSADVLLALVKVADRTPLSTLHVPYPDTPWTLAALAWVVLAIAVRGGRRLLAMKFIGLAAIVIWLLWPMWMQATAAPLRIDMLAVGDGSCYVLRSGDSTAVFDAGSSTDLNVGKRSLIPAMRHLGVRAIDTIAISHADLDHYSAAIELVDEFDVGEVLVTPQFMAEAKAAPLGPAAYLVEGLTRRRVPVIETAAGAQRQFGVATWTWLNPVPDRSYAIANDSSMVIQVRCAGQRVLLCGDIQQEAMDQLLRTPESVRAEVVELPHHGSHHEFSEFFIDRVNPAVVMQSTGWTRWRRDQWAGKLSGVQRLVTARDGACWVEIGQDGRIETGRFLKQGLVPGAGMD